MLIAKDCVKILLKQCFLIFLSVYPEPNAPPSNVQGRNISSTSILVQWGDVPAADQNGIILSYTVTYIALPGGTPKAEVVIAPTTETTLTGLNEYTNYSITVFASTVKGDGNVSEPIIVITDGDSKLLFRILSYTQKRQLFINERSRKNLVEHYLLLSSRRKGVISLCATRILYGCSIRATRPTSTLALLQQRL